MARRRAGAADPGPEAWAASREAGGTPGAPNFPTGPLPPGIRFSEISGAGESPIRIELVNEGTTPVSLASVRLNAFTPPAGTLAPGAFIVLDDTQFGFRPVDGERLFLYGEGGATLLDAVTARATGRARLDGRMLVPMSPSFGSTNPFDLEDDVVVNELMYRSPPLASRAGSPAVVASVEILPIDAVWRYRADNIDPGPGWAATAHPVGGPWQQGAGLLGFETTPSVLPDLLRTPFVSSNAVSYYFETEFTLTPAQLAGLTHLRLEHVIDDGAVFYANGVEVPEWRFNMPPGAVTHGTLATGGVTNAVLSAPVDAPASSLNLVAGLNRVSVSVHQQIATGNDMVCGARLSIATTVTPAVPAAPVTPNPEEWIELYNRGASDIDLGGWSLSDAVSFTIPPDTRLPAGGFLVIANHHAALRAKWPERAAQIIGDFSGSLANGGERLELRDARGNPADEARYLPSWRSDGGGSSLELPDPRSDNSQPAAWVDSDESAKSEWQTFFWRAPATQRFGPTMWNELRLGMLDVGECLIDDLSVRRDPDGAAVEVLRNGGFEGQPAGAHWRFLGNHSASTIAEDPIQPGGSILHFKATGPTETNHNHAETTFVNNSALTSGLHEVRLRARWLAGTNQLNVRAYYQKLAKTIELPIPARLGTPGTTNSRAIVNAGPVLTDLRHAPPIPAASVPVTVSCAATDPDGVAAGTLFYRLNGTANFTEVAMTASDGQWTATIPGQAAGAIVHFYIALNDTPGARSHLPARGPDARALVQWQDNQTSALPAHQLRLIMLTADRTFLLNNFNRLSNDRVPGTLVYRGSEVFHDVGVRLQGTAAGRVRDGDAYIGYDIAFPPDHLFRGVHDSIGIDRSARTPVVRRQDEIYVRHSFNRAGLPCTTDDLCYFIAPATGHTGTAILQLASYGGLWADSQFEEAEGTVYNWDITYDPSTTSVAGNPESLKPPVPFGHIATDLVNLGPDKEQYRGPFDIRAGKRRDSYEGLMELARVMALPSAQLAIEAPRVLDLDQVFRCTALVNLWGIVDTYYTGGLQHNIRLFVPDSGRGINFLPWDMDFVMGGASNSPLIPSGNNLGRLIVSSPGHRRLYLGHVRHLCESAFTTSYLNPWFSHFGSVVGHNFSATSSYVTARRTYAQSQYPAQAPFAITTGNGEDFTTEAREAVLEGTGWIDVKEIRRGGVALALTWLDLRRWRATLPLDAGANAITLDAIGFSGETIASRTLNITSTAAPEPKPRDFLRITEIHYHPADPSTDAELAASTSDGNFEFIELRNIGTLPLRFDGVRFTEGIDFVVPDNTTLGPGQFGVVVRHAASFAARYGTDITVLGTYAPTSLSNSGETITLVDATGAVVQSFSFADTWIPESDGPGWSLVVRDEQAPSADLNTAASWQASRQFHGNPGAPNRGDSPAGFNAWQLQHFSAAELADPALSGPSADPAGTGIPHLLRYAAGFPPHTTTPPPHPTVSQSQNSLVLDFRRLSRTPDLEWSLESSSSLTTWSPVPVAPVVLQSHNDATETVRWSIPLLDSPTPFLRLRITQRGL
ncbi:MAG: lamin tail domain-containing protein [Verrucomicrobiales bacterium]